jgi:cytidylate kinase
VGEIITIDGPGGSGKSTIAKLMARKLNFIYLDTGAMYRAVALAALRNGIPFDQEARLSDLCQTIDLRFEHTEDASRLLLNGEDVSQAIRSPEMDIASSTVSAVRAVRFAMTDLQRRLSQDLNVVAEGRDMGTVVFPDARNKFFLTARPEVRARRRYRERQKRGEEISFEEVASLLAKRDQQDASRNLAPLKPAEDAVMIDSSDLEPTDVVKKMMAHVNSTLRKS